MPAKTMTGAQAIVQGLQNQGVEYIFGYSGGAAMPIFDALIESPIKFVLTRHEQGATHAADGYARATGKAGVVLVTSGPGATNTITGIMTAYMDSAPLVVLCGQVVQWTLGTDAFQEADVSGISFPIVKHSYLIKNKEDIPRIIKEAFLLAETGRPGPVLIDLPKDVSMGEFQPDFTADVDLPGYTIPEHGAASEIEAAAELLHAAKQPVLLVGHGAVIANAAKGIRLLVEKMKIPVVNTLLGKGAFPEDHDLSLGMLGMHGTAYANFAVRECDLIMSIGSRWDDRILGDPDKFCADAKKIHVDIDRAEHDKMLDMDVFIHGDARLVVDQLLTVVRPGKTKAWVEQCRKWRKQYPLKYRKQGGLRVEYVLDRLNEMLDPHDTVVTDVGQHQMWAAQYMKTKMPRHFISSGGAGTMGFGMPAAIGAQFAHPDERVVAICGDGGFQMTMPELATAALHRLPIKVVIMENRFLGMVRQWQDLFFDNRLSGVNLDGNPNFVKLAACFEGAKAFRVKRKADVDRTLQKAFDYNDGPCLIIAEVEQEDNVFPMIPSGKTYHDMMLERPADSQA